MKKIFPFPAFIAGLLLIACVNKTSNTTNEQTINIDNKPTLQFTSEEIAYNDSIKNLKMDYVRMVEELSGEIDSPKTLRYLESEYNITGVTQEEIYLDSYDWLCHSVLLSVSDRVNALENNETLLLLKFSIKILNKDGKDIAPLINFPNKQAKQDSIWNKFTEFVKANPLPSIRPNMYKQPIINEKEPLTLKHNTDLLNYTID